MDDTALARGHRAELIGRAGLANFFGGDGGGGAEFLNSLRAMVVAVEADLFVFAGGQPQHFQGEQLEGAQEFSAAVEQQGGVGASEIDEDLGLFPVAIVGDGRVDDDAVFQVKTAVGDDGLEEFVDLVGGGDFIHMFLATGP